MDTTMRASILLAGLALVAAAEPGWTASKGIRFWNLTTATVSVLQLSPVAKGEWGPNQTLNDKDREVDHDERLRITSVEPGRYDVRIGYPGGRTCVVRNVEIAADAVFSISDKDLTECTKK